MDRSELTGRVAAVLENFPTVHLVYLFGSQVGDATDPLSDIDLGVLVERGGDDMQVQAELAHELGKAVPPLQVDLVPLHRAPVEDRPGCLRLAVRYAEARRIRGGCVEPLWRLPDGAAGAAPVAPGGGRA